MWMDDVLFYNTLPLTATVRLLGVSNGIGESNPADLLLPPGTLVSLNASAGPRNTWRPTEATPMWMVHLDIPEGVIIESRDESYVLLGVGSIPPLARGKVSMPIVRALTPANQPQVVLGTDLGGVDSRVNVAVYNAGPSSATVTIEVRRACDSALVDSAVASIPPNSVTQVGGFIIGDSSTCAATAPEPWARYTVVTVSQPSIAFVSNINESLTPSPAELGVIPLNGLGVARNEIF